MESDNPIVNGDGPLDGPSAPEDRNSRLEILSVLPMLIGLSWLRGPLFCINLNRRQIVKYRQGWAKYTTSCI